MRSIRSIVFIIIAFLYVSGCEQAVDIYFKMTEERDSLLCFFPFRDQPWPKDTAIIFERKWLRRVSFTKNRQDTYEGQVWLGLGTPESVFEEWKADTVSVFLFDPEVVNNTPWENVVKEYLVLWRFDLTKKDLDKLHWTLHLPPTEEMAGMHMWPR